LRATSELRFRLKIDSVAEKKIGCRPRIGGNRRWRYLRLELKAKKAVGSRRRRQRHDEGYHGSRLGAPAGGGVVHTAGSRRARHDPRLHRGAAGGGTGSGARPWALRSAQDRGG